MLDELTEELLEMGRGMLCLTIEEGLEVLYASLYFVGFEGH
jgi:hypothetical protein